MTIKKLGSKLNKKLNEIKCPEMKLKKKNKLRKWLKILIKRMMIKLNKKIKWDKISWDKI